MSLSISLREWVVLVSLSALSGVLGASGGCAKQAGPSTGGSTSSGGAGGGANCTGTPRACTGLDDFDCVTTNGCTHAGQCQGTALDCASLSSIGCAKQSGCSTVPGSCSGSPQQCFNFGNQPSCSAQKGCFWDANNFFCNGNPTPCQQIPGDSCGAQIGCTSGQIASCAGTPAACATFTDDDGCKKEIGCVWVSQCSGTPTACETFSDFDCPYQPGCTCTGCGGSGGSGGAGGAPPCVLASDCDPAVDPCKTGDCINGECIRVPACKVCVKQIDCDPHTQPCLTGNCIDQKCEISKDCPVCTAPADCDKSVNACFSGNCTDGICEVTTECGSGDGCCPSGCSAVDDTDCP